MASRVTRRRVGLAVAALVIGASSALYAVTRVPPARTCHIDGRLPDGSAQCTPGVLSAAVEQSNLEDTICKSGYTKTVRPKTGYTTPLERDLIKTYGLRGTPQDYELDHLIPLELGGNPPDVRNLWPEPYEPRPGAHEKDRLENYLKRQVCAGAMTLAAAQKAISSNWVEAYRKAFP